MSGGPPKAHPDPRVLQRERQDAHAEKPTVLDVGLLALHAAIARYDAVAPQPDLPKAFAAAAEAVWWICSLDEQLNGGTTNNKTPYAQARDHDAAGCCIPGLRWARDQLFTECFSPPA